MFFTAAAALSLQNIWLSCCFIQTMSNSTAYIWFKTTDKRKTTFNSGNNESEINFILVSIENRKFLIDVKVIPWELQHRLLVAYVDKRKLNKVVKKESRVRRMVWK